MKNYTNACNQTDGYDSCYTCTAPGRNNFYCPVDGNCYNNATVPNPDNLTLPCGTFLLNQTDQCTFLPGLESPACDDIYFYSSDRERWTIYENIVVTLEAQTAC